MTREAAIKILMGGELNPCVAEDREACDMAIKALEQEPKSEWEQDHAILKAYSDGMDEVLDKLRAEIDKARFVDKDTRICKNALASGLEVALQIIDKYKGENEG